MRCYAEGEAHDFPFEDDTGASCPEHGVTLLWRGEPIAAADLAVEADTSWGGLTTEADGLYSVVCRGASVSDLPAAHAVCRQPDCVCACHVTTTVLQGGCPRRVDVFPPYGIYRLHHSGIRTTPQYKGDA
ncbi:hypothetical protein [Streptomyces sp. NPDC058629]|uniref:hypothetical protein n=1 Tax=Streptomyces sp. NPDC058629 TaxID=3346565 RepID=UPI00364993CF